MKRKITIYLAVILLTVTFLSTEALSFAEEEFHQTCTVDPGTKVEFENRNGKVYICSWDKDYVDVYAVKRTKKDQDELDRVKIEVNTNGFLEIKTVYEKYNNSEKDSFFRHIFGFDSHNIAEVTVDYTIKLPDEVFLRKAKIRNGSIEINDTRGDMTVHSRNGKIFLDNADECIEAEARNGNITITGGTLVRRVKTRNGNVEIFVSDNEFKNMSITTRNGAVDIHLLPDFNGNIDFKTRNGKISAGGIPLSLEKISKEHILGTIGSGGRTISVTTRNGRITLRQD